MHITMENATIYIAIITFAVWIAKCLIVSPLKESISGLQRAIEKLEKSISILDSKIDQHDTRLVRSRPMRARELKLIKPKLKL